jgi:hypothetical protein
MLALSPAVAVSECLGSVGRIVGAATVNAPKLVASRPSLERAYVLALILKVSRLDSTERRTVGKFAQ